MSQLEKLKMYLDPAKTDWTEAEENQLTLLLDFAGDKILKARYPFGTSITDVPVMFSNLQIRMAVDLYGKMGAEGQTSHSENGISRVWETADVSRSLLREVTPMVGGWSNEDVGTE